MEFSLHLPRKKKGKGKQSLNLSGTLAEEGGRGRGTEMSRVPGFKSDSRSKTVIKKSIRCTTVEFRFKNTSIAVNFS